MKLNSRERSKLALRQAGQLAQQRLARGVRLNHPESVALIALQVMELARDGEKTVAELMSLGRTFLGKNQVLPEVPFLIKMVQVEATFRDGTKLVTVDSPISRPDGDLSLALYGSFLPVPEMNKFKPINDSNILIPGEIFTLDEELVLNKGRKVISMKVKNTGDRPVQVGSHFHFAEVNKCVEMNRIAARGKRLDIPAGTAVRLEPGEAKTVQLVELGGNKLVNGGNNLHGNTEQEFLTNIKSGNFIHVDTEIKEVQGATISRKKYSELYGPTVGDRVRLGNTALVAKVEKDFASESYGDECVFGGGKVIREGMGQSCGINPDHVGVLETVITNALIIDWTGIYKADIGIKNGRIMGIGKAGNPDTMSNVSPGMIISNNTEVIAGEGQIVTAGAFDAHVHFICPQLCNEAIESGVTTLLGGGTGPATGTCATTCTPHPSHIEMMLKSTEEYPLNFGFTGKGNSSRIEGLTEAVEAGAVGLKLHEDWGTTPAAIDMALTVAEKEDVQITIHTDTLNESCCCEDSIEAFKGRTIHTYHSEGAGGGHSPDIIRVCGEPKIIPSSTNPTRPYTVNTIDEHLDMLMVCHHLKKNIREDVSFAESRIRAETIAAEDILHDMGAISIVASDSQAMGRQAEVIARTWQTAHKMKVQRGTLEGDEADNDNLRIKRYIAKYTINPAIAHGMSHEIGSVEVGKLADLVLWKPGFFGIKPEIVVKGGQIAYAQMGDPNASVPTCEPVQMLPMFGAKGAAVGETSIAFVSKSSIEKGIATTYGLKKKLVAVENCRGIGKADMKLNSALPKIEVDPETYMVKADGKELGCEPLEALPLAQPYSLF
eukprot:maker-scaffold_7-snap-gene-10.22-mRNA-1 protein AED:0.02 eAED:0.02 QI:133/1/1/1/0.75/0.6/5/62/830